MRGPEETSAARPSALEAALAQVEDLKRSVETFERLVGSVRDLVWRTDPNGKVLYVNAYVEELLGYSPAEAVGGTLADYFPPEIAKRVAEAALQTLFATPPAPAFTVDVAYLHKDGRLVPAELRVSAEREGSGNIVALTGVSRDASPVRRAELALRESQDRYRLIAENTSDGIVLFGPDNRVEYVSPTYLRQLGYPEHEELGRSAENIYALVHPDDRDAVFAKIFKAIGAKESCVVYTYRARHVDGHYVWREDSAQLRYDDSSARNYLGCCVVCRDVTERKRVEADLEESREMSRGLSDASFDAIFISEKGRCIGQNRRAEEMFGYSSGEALGRFGTDWILHADRELVMKNMLEGHERAYEATGLRKDGSTFPAVLHGRMMHFKGRAVRVTSMTDITDRKRAEAEKAALEAQLRQAEKMDSVGRLAGGIAHDFNNMLSVILGCSQLLLDDVDESHPFHADLAAILAAAQRSASLTRRLLALARRQVVAPRVLNLNDTVASMRTMLQTLLGEAVTLSWRPTEGVWPVFVDPAQLDHVLANLCANARDAIAGVGKVTFETENRTFEEKDCAARAELVPGDYVRISVTDDGAGMNEHTLGHVFEPFFTTKPAGKGTGLGLATVYGAVRQSGGFIEVESAEGKGTTFSIFLPRHTRTTEPSTWPEEASTAPSRGQETILVVEDEPAVLTMLTSLLERLGYAVLAAGSAREAVLIAREHGGELDLLLTDVVMPEMNGFELAETLVGLRPTLKLLYMSGYASDRVASQGVLTEGRQFLRKPFSQESLAAKVREALDDV